VWQSRFRSWSLRADLVATEHALGVAAYSQVRVRLRLRVRVRLRLRLRVS